jgi:hypothetical protein
VLVLVVKVIAAVIPQDMDLHMAVVAEAVLAQLVETLLVEH